MLDLGRRFGWWRRAAAVLAVLGTLVVPAAPAAAQTCTWAGTWSTTFGDMEIEQIGNAAIAMYSYHDGALIGLVSGMTLRGTWGEGPGYGEPDSAGALDLTMAPNCNSFGGTWRNGSYGSPSAWNARRTGGGSARPLRTGCAWDGTFDTNFGQMVMSQSGSSVIGYYESRSGQLSLTANGAYAGGSWGEFPSGSGEAEFVQAGNCGGFIGRWRNGSNGDWSIWIGYRL